MLKWIQTSLLEWIIGAWQVPLWQQSHNHLVCKRTLNQWPVWLNGWVLVYELSGCGFESCSCHLKFRYRACFEQRVAWYSGRYRVQFHPETRTWHGNNIQLSPFVLEDSNRIIKFCNCSADNFFPPYKI